MIVGRVFNDDIQSSRFAPVLYSGLCNGYLDETSCFLTTVIFTSDG